MTPAARIQAAIEIVDEVAAAAAAGGAAADTIIQRFFKTRRYAGAKDRRAVRELAYHAMRRAGEAPISGRAALLGLACDQPELLTLFDGGPHAPAAIRAGESGTPAGIAPAWLVERLGHSLDDDELPALLARAPLDVRVNTLKASRAEVTAELPDAIVTPHSPTGLRLPDGSQLATMAAAIEGRIEVQDEGSQLAAALCGARPGTLVVDLCAGGGGKTLALAAAMANRGRIVACDADRARLSHLLPRAERAGVVIAETRLLDSGREAPSLADLAGRADLVVIDAPCSGTGTWRRNPEARWRLTPERLDRLVAVQRRLLALGATLVRPGGHLAWIICSLLDEEGRDAIADFLGREPDWAAGPLGSPAGRPHGAGLRLTPAHDGTDGFFVARLRRPC